MHIYTEALNYTLNYVKQKMYNTFWKTQMKDWTKNNTSSRCELSSTYTYYLLDTDP